MMSTAPSLATPVHLTWIKSNVKGRYELTSNGPILGSLQRVGFWKSTSRAEFNNQSWSFQRSGLSSTQILQQPGDRPIARFTANWLGGGMLTFVDGRKFKLTTKGFFRPVWSWTDDQGYTLLDVTPHNKSVVLVGNVDSYLPVLIMFSWHQILQANDEATTMAMSAAVG
jgi:hypothetical protein